MKNLYKLSMLLIALTISTGLMAQTATAPAGTGTSSDPYQIATLNNLYWLSQTSASWSSGIYIIQTANIDATATSGWDGGLGFSPIAPTTSSPYSGNYNGQNYEIDGLTLHRTTNLQGLFGYVSNSAIIKNIILLNASITGNDAVGGIAGANTSGTTISGCQVKNITLNCTSTTGGITGSNDGSISKCSVSGNINSTGNVGGIVGSQSSNSASISECYNTANLYTSGSFCGGIVAWFKGTVSNCYFRGSIHNGGGSLRCGGIIGYFNAYSTPSAVTNCFSSGFVAPATFGGGLIGNVSGSHAVITSSYWDTETSGYSYSAGGTGKTTAEMKTQSTFTAWDFTSIWTINGTTNAGYPYLQNLIPSTITWEGLSSSDWNTASNWNTNSVPKDYQDVILTTNGTSPTISSGTGANCLHLTVNSGAILNNEGGGSLITDGDITNEGTINIARTISNGQWHMISAPVPNATANTFTNEYLQSWDESSATWTDITDQATPLVKLRGYSLWGITGTTAYTFSGTPYTGDQNISLTASGSGGSYNGANLLGNPYPSSIDWSGLNSSYGAVYYWNGTAYVSWNGSGSGSQYIPPMQGFFIVASAAGTFNLSNTNRTHSGATDFYKSSNEITNGLVLQASNGSYQDALYIKFNDRASSDFELEKDAYKFLSNTSGISQLYSLSGDKKLSIDTRPETDIIQLGFNNNLNGVYQIGIQEIDGIDEAILEDTKTGTFHNLQNDAYEFTWNTSDDETRFILHLKATGTNDLATSNAEIFAYQKTIHIRSSKKLNNAHINIVDMMGRIVYEHNLVDGQNESIILPLEDGVYLVQLESDSRSVVKKVVLQ